MRPYVLIAAFSIGCTVVTQPPLSNPGDPLPGLDQNQMDRFVRGKEVFSREFEAPALGPLFNSTSCKECHEIPVVGGSGGGEVGGADVETHASNFSNGTCDELVADGGPVFRHQTTGPPLQRIPPSVDLGFGHRTTPPLFGFGLLEAVPAHILEDLQVKTGGRVHRLRNGQIGRFGRKATDPDLTTFITGAFATEQGIETPSEISIEDRDLTVDFVRFLAPISHGEGDHHGERLFRRIGCAQCHVPKLPTEGMVPGEVEGYTDLLLHEMGAVDQCRGSAKPSEFRTAPLMGIRFLKTFMHDGRAVTIRDAVLAHGGQANEARRRFEDLSDEEQSRLLIFVNSL